MRLLFLLGIYAKQHLWSTWWGEGQRLRIGNELGLWWVKPSTSEGISKFQLQYTSSNCIIYYFIFILFSFEIIFRFQMSFYMRLKQRLERHWKKWMPINGAHHPYCNSLVLIFALSSCFWIIPDSRTSNPYIHYG